MSGRVPAYTGADVTRSFLDAGEMTEEISFRERVAVIYLRQFLQKHIDITETMRYNQFNKSGFGRTINCNLSYQA